MWRTQLGERALRGGEWALVREGISTLWDQVEESLRWDDLDPYEIGIAAFDRLQPNQQLAVLAMVGRALSDADVPSPELTAHGEGAVAAVFRLVRNEIETEIDLGRHPGPAGLGPELAANITRWRKLAVGACRATLAEGQWPPTDDGSDEDAWEGPLPDEDSDDEAEWEAVVEWLGGRVLWDDGDYDAGDDFLDLEPAEARARMAWMRIDPAYFTAIAPDPTGGQLAAVRATLRELCERR